MLLSINAFAEQVKGVVVDEAGQPVTGAFVLQKGTSNGTVTDVDGQFNLDVPSDAVLEVSCLGYVAQAKKLGWDESVWDLSADTPKLK
jgi:hypothetical protein